MMAEWNAAVRMTLVWCWRMVPRCVCPSTTTARRQPASLRAAVDSVFALQLPVMDKLTVMMGQCVADDLDEWSADSFCLWI